MHWQEQYSSSVRFSLVGRWMPALLLMLVPQLALAHSPMAGIGKFYGGMLHPLLVLPHALALLMFGMLVGQRGVRAMRYAYPAFLVALSAGLLLSGIAAARELQSETILLAFTLGCGLLVALQLSLPLWLFSLLAAGVGLVVGLDSGIVADTPQETFGALLGSGLGALILLIVVAGVVELAGKDWQRLAVRVLGSWGTAGAVLVLALSLRV